MLYCINQVWFAFAPCTCGLLQDKQHLPHEPGRHRFLLQTCRWHTRDHSQSTRCTEPMNYLLCVAIYLWITKLNSNAGRSPSSGCIFVFVGSGFTFKPPVLLVSFPFPLPSLFLCFLMLFCLTLVTVVLFFFSSPCVILLRLPLVVASSPWQRRTTPTTTATVLSQKGTQCTDSSNLRGKSFISSKYDTIQNKINKETNEDSQ